MSFRHPELDSGSSSLRPSLTDFLNASMPTEIIKQIPSKTVKMSRGFLKLYIKSVK